MSKNTKRHLISAGLTFLTAFGVAILPMIETIELNDLKTGAVYGVIFTAARAGVKALFEYLLVPAKIG